MAELARDLAIRRQLLVALHQRRLRAGGGTAVFPRAAVHDAAEIRHVGLAQDLWDTDQHVGGFRPSVRIWPRGPSTRCGRAPPARTAPHSDTPRRNRAC